MNLDFRTLFFIIFLLPLLYSIGIFILARLWLNIKGINFISLALFMEASGFFLIVLRGMIPPFLSVLVANALLLSGAFFFYKGIICIRSLNIQLRWMQWIWGLLFLLYFLSFYYYTFVNPDVSSRIVLISSFLCVGYILCTYVSLKNIENEVKLYLYSLASAFLSAVIFLIVRIVFTSVEPSIKHLMVANNTQIIIMLMHILFLTGKTFGILSLLARMNSLEQAVHLKHELSQQKQIVIFQHKMACMGEMIATISHQLKQPLASILGILANLGDDFDNKKLSEQRLNNYLDQAENLSIYMSHTIDDFSEYLAPDNDKQKFNISQLIKRSMTLTKTLLKQSDIKMNIEAKEPFDEQPYSTLLIQVLIILIQNARDALVLSHNENKMINIQYYKKNKQTYIIVKDNAGGIDDKNKEKIFQPYFSGNTLSKGRGLGLHIARTLIEENFNGRLFVSNDEHGAVFTIELKIVKATQS